MRQNATIPPHKANIHLFTVFLKSNFIERVGTVRATITVPVIRRSTEEWIGLETFVLDLRKNKNYHS